MNKADLDYFMSLPDEELLARCIWGEARGESIEDMVAVANVVINRLGKKIRYGSTIKEVILKPWQFSCFNEKDENFPLLRQGPKDKYFDICKSIAKLACKGLLVDNTDKANLYYVKFGKNAITPPKWASAENVTATVDFTTHGSYREA